MGYVRPVIQTVTNHLPIHYWISSTTYTINNYNVNNKQQKIQNIGNNWKLLQNHIDCADYLW